MIKKECLSGVGLFDAENLLILLLLLPLQLYRHKKVAYRASEDSVDSMTCGKSNYS